MSPARMSRVESGARALLAFSEAFNRHDVAGMMRLVTDDCLYEHAIPAPEGTTYVGKEAIAHFWQEFFQASPRAHVTVEEVFGLGLRCVMRWRYEWVDGAGNGGHVRGTSLIQVKGGLISEMFAYVKGRDDACGNAPEPG